MTTYDDKKLKNNWRLTNVSRKTLSL